MAQCYRAFRRGYERQKNMMTAIASSTTIATVSIQGLPLCSTGSEPGFFILAK